MEAIPMMNRSAKDGARSSLHYGGEGVPIHPSHQGVCGRHGTEGSCVTHGDLVLSANSSKTSYKAAPKCLLMRCKESESQIVL